MKKLVLKTVLITLAAIIATTCALYGALAFFSPKTLAEFWNNAGNYAVSVKYYEKQYEKSGEISDLAGLCAKLDVKNDSAKAVKYLTLFTGSERFSTFCEQEDKSSGYKMTSYEYYYGIFTVAHYYQNGLSSAITVAKKAVNGGYTEYNAFYVLLSEVGLTKDGGNAVATEISAIKETLSDETEIGFAERDINIANAIKQI